MQLQNIDSLFFDIGFPVFKIIGGAEYNQLQTQPLLFLSRVPRALCCRLSGTPPIELRPSSLYLCITICSARLLSAR